jgi:hypothetical protein
MVTATEPKLASRVMRFHAGHYRHLPPSPRYRGIVELFDLGSPRTRRPSVGIMTLSYVSATGLVARDRERPRCVPQSEGGPWSTKAVISSRVRYTCPAYHGAPG